MGYRKNRNVKIFIDNLTYEKDDQYVTAKIKDGLRKIKNEMSVQVREFKDLPYLISEDEDPENSAGMIKAINESDIVISIISRNYFDYIDGRIETALSNVADSNSRYFLPLIIHEVDWSNYDWLVRSQLTPKDGAPLFDSGVESQDKIINDFLKKVKLIISILGGTSSVDLIKTSSDIVDGNTIFISHDHDDADFAELLKLRLEKAGIESWIDTERLKIGQDWRTEIDIGIENCAAIVVIMTPEARKSEYVTYEWAYAWGKDKKIFPLMLKKTQLHPRLESLQYLNFTSNPTRPWDELISSLKNAIEERNA